MWDATVLAEQGTALEKKQKKKQALTCAHR